MKDDISLIKLDDSHLGKPNFTNQMPLGSIFPSPQADEIGKEDLISEKEKTKINFDLKPEQLEAYLKNYIVRQESAIEILATKICTHFQCLKLDGTQPAVGSIKNNIIMIGPTGVGKTYLVKLIANKIGVPFVKADATKFSETGYVGGDVEQLVRDLVDEAGGDIALAESGIIYIDEIDKIASGQGNGGLDVSRTGVQRNLLKLLEETDVDLKIPHDLASQLEAAMRFQKTGKIERKKVNTRNILFIVSGAFNDLEKIVSKRLNRSSVGFKNPCSASENLTSTQLLQRIKGEDLFQYGFESEFVGRLPVIAVLESLSKNDLFQILSNSNCPIILNKRRDFKAYGIDVKFESEALRAIAEIAFEEKTGARGLVSVMERVLLKFEKKLPSSAIKHFAVTEKTIMDPEGELKTLLTCPEISEEIVTYNKLIDKEKEEIRKEIAAFEAESQNRLGFPIQFSLLGIDYITNQVMAKEKSVEEFLNEISYLWKDMREYEEEFHKEYSIKIHFDNDARDLIVKHALEEKKKVADICGDILNNYEHGFALVRTKLENNSVILTKEAVNEPVKYLNKLIAGYFPEKK